MSAQRFRLHDPVHVFAALALACVLASPPPSAAVSDVPAPAELFLNTTVRHVAVEPSPGAVAAVRFRVEVPHAGLLTLDLSIAGGAPPEPMLRLVNLSFPTGGQTSDALRRVAQTPAALLVELRQAETLLVEVAALDHDQSLPAFKLRSAFQATASTAVGPIEKDVNPWDDDLDGKNPPPPPPPPSGTVVGQDLCALGEQDDHGDVPRCATPIGSATTVAGVLHNDTGDDEDLFLFRLPVTAVIAVEAVSDSALQLVLRDRDGLAVVVTRSAGGGTSLRLARALAAGRYFLEVESLNGDEAVYALTLHRPSRP